MNNPVNMDLDARAELLTYLVASYLLAHHTTGQWLTAEHLVESTCLWFSSNGAGTDILSRVRLAGKANGLAQELVGRTEFDSAAVREMFGDNLRLDYRLPRTREIYQVCLNRLALN